MLTSIDLDSENALSVPILGVSPKESILIRQVTGLNPPDLNLFIGDYSRDGGIYQGRRVGNRNVVFTMELNPNPALGETVASLRERLYKAFVDPLVEADYLKVGLNIDDGRKMYLVGYTEKFETEIFSTDTLAQISMICPDPYIRDEEATILTHPTGWTTVPFSYTGTAETGFEVKIYINAATERLVLANNTATVGVITDPSSGARVENTADPLYSRGRMVLEHSFKPGDIITINTVRGARKLWLTSSDGTPEQRVTTKSLIAALTPTSPWIELHSQSNLMKVYGTLPTDLPASIRSLTYVQAYWGV